jgi:HK97 family phage prohead protease
MNKELMQRSFNFEVRALKNENKYTLTGIPIVYDQRTDLGWFDEEIVRGALDKTDLKDVRFLVNHDTSKIPLARSRNNNANSTMRLQVTERGLEIEVDLDCDNNAEARSLYSAVERGDISGMSFMFGVRGEDWENLDSDHPLRKITDISTVVEVSAVTFPAYEQTEITARDKLALDNAKKTLDSVRKKSLDSDKEKLELEKTKALFL